MRASHVKLKLCISLYLCLKLSLLLFKEIKMTSFGKHVLITIFARSSKISDKFLNLRKISDLKYLRRQVGPKNALNLFFT